jgi:hypothetical protein
MTGYQSKKAAALDKLESMEREALKLALEALIWTTGSNDFGEGGQAREGAIKLLFPAITAAQAALAQPAQEPVAIVAVDVSGQIQVGWIKKPQHNDKLYTTPPQRTWVGLTGNEWFEWWRVSQVANETEAEIDFGDFILIAQAVAAKLKEKNS